MWEACGFYLKPPQDASTHSCHLLCVQCPSKVEGPGGLEAAGAFCYAEAPPLCRSAGDSKDSLTDPEELDLNASHARDPERIPMNMVAVPRGHFVPATLLDMNSLDDLVQQATEAKSISNDPTYEDLAKIWDMLEDARCRHGKKDGYCQECRDAHEALSGVTRKLS